MWSKVIWASMVALIWAGVSLGGSLVAAPAKFTAPSLEMSVALEVGRSQFRWLGYTESVLLILLVIALILARRSLDWRIFLIPLVAFLIQQIGIMPKLGALTLQAIEGAPERSSYLHIFYVIVEVIKFVGLIVAGAFCLHRSA